MVQEKTTITAAEIARRAGVGRAAVSNWRKRHADFPHPVGGTAASPEFDLAAVDRWLRDQGKLPELSPIDHLWSRLAPGGEQAAEALAGIGALLLARQRDERGARRCQADPYLTGLLPEVDSLVDTLGPQMAFDELWQRFAVSGTGRPPTTPDSLADLMVALAAAAGGTLLDPACGSGAILRAAVRAGCTAAYGQELDQPLARLAGVWLALREVPGEVSPGDSLRADAFHRRQVDAVVCHPPFGVTNWGHDELGYDDRWEYGVPPRTEPELAWVQHALSHLHPGGHAVLVMPPAAAGRRAGRRIRAELLRRGALRAVVALPAGAAAPHGVPLHLWLLRRPAAELPTPSRVLLVDATVGVPTGTYDRVLAAWRAFNAAPDQHVDETGFVFAAPVIDLLDDEVDLTPARRQPVADGTRGAERLVSTRELFSRVLAELPALMPHADPESGEASTTVSVSVADLVRTGALHLYGLVRSGTTEEPAGGGSDGLPVFTVQDVVDGVAASGRDTGQLTQRIPLLAGDVVVPAAARQFTARVVTGDGALLGRGLYLLRVNPLALDPWFLAGQLRTTANEKQTSSLSGTLRYDVRRAQVRRLPLDEQRAYGVAFRRLMAFESAVRGVARLGTELVQLTADGLALGVIPPDRGRPA